MMRIASAYISMVNALVPAYAYEVAFFEIVQDGEAVYYENA
jgi:hypothetical protein